MLIERVVKTIDGKEVEVFRIKVGNWTDELFGFDAFLGYIINRWGPQTGKRGSRTVARENQKDSPPVWMSFLYTTPEAGNSIEEKTIKAQGGETFVGVNVRFTNYYEAVLHRNNMNDIIKSMQAHLEYEREQAIKAAQAVKTP